MPVPGPPARPSKGEADQVGAGVAEAVRVAAVTQ